MSPYDGTREKLIILVLGAQLLKISVHVFTNEYRNKNSIKYKIKYIKILVT